MQDGLADVTSHLARSLGWDAAAGWDAAPAELTLTGPRTVLPSSFDVTGLAAGAVALATHAAARHHAVRQQRDQAPVTVDSGEACGAFLTEGLFAAIGWTQPPLWDPIAGNYRATDGWIRLHTNYATHRAAVEDVLGTHDRAAAEAAVSSWAASELETAIVDAGGCAAVMHDRDGWLGSSPGAATTDAAAVATAERECSGIRSSSAERPFDGVRVLDLTRVIAGPVCTRVLAGWGADVLRVDPPGFAEVASLLPETTLGKRTTSLDLTAADDRQAFQRLLAEADVLVSGLRADALDRLGYDDQTLTELNPDLIIASLDAYGWSGPWRARRGFDSLVQMSCGIAADSGAFEPVPLPAQALDHATGWLLAAAVANALTRRLTHTRTARIRASLIGTANLLYSLPRPADPRASTPTDFAVVDTVTAWGPGRRAVQPGRIDGRRAHFAIDAGPLGRRPAAWW